MSVSKLYMVVPIRTDMSKPNLQIMNLKLIYTQFLVENRFDVFIKTNFGMMCKYLVGNSKILFWIGKFEILLQKYFFLNYTGLNMSYIFCFQILKVKGYNFFNFDVLIFLYVGHI